MLVLSSKHSHYNEQSELLFIKMKQKYYITLILYLLRLCYYNICAESK